MIAFNDPSYGEMVLHPPPVSYATALIVLFLPIKPVMKYVCKSFSYMMYWIENIIVVFMFMFIEMLLLPISYIKIWYNLIRMSQGFCRTLGYCILWVFIGIPVMIFLFIRDIGYLLYIFSFH